MLGIIVVPGDIVMIEEGEELVSILFNSLLKCRSNFCRTSEGRDIVEKSLRSSLVLAKISPPEPVAIDGSNDLPKQPTETGRDESQLVVERVLEHVLVDVAH